MTSRKPLLVGPFAEAERHAQVFSTNILAAYFLTQSVEKYEQTKEEYENAIEEDMSEDIIKQKKMLMEASRITMTLAAQMYTGEEATE